MAIQPMTYRHKKSGRLYKLTGIILDKTHDTELLFYSAEHYESYDPAGFLGYARTREDFEENFEVMPT